MDDAQIRFYVGERPVPDHRGDGAFTRLRDVRQATVALVSTGGLHQGTDAPWSRWDEGFRVVPHIAPAPRLGIWSPNFDRSGWLADPNVVFPRAPLDRLAQTGQIKQAARRHLSFMGALRGELAHLRDVAAPMAASLLREDGVEAAIILPVCPSCTSVAAIVANRLEASGIATAMVSLVRRHVEILRPPRALQCDFPFGRPLGHPRDSLFQTDLLGRLIGMLESATEPVLADHPDRIRDERDAPLGEPAPIARLGGIPADEVRALIAALAARADLAGSFDPESPARALAALAGFARVIAGQDWGEANLPAHPTDAALEVRTLFEAAFMRLHATVPPARATERWFFEDCAAGRLIVAAQRAMRARGDARDNWFYMTPYRYSLA